MANQQHAAVALVTLLFQNVTVLMLTSWTRTEPTQRKYLAVTAVLNAELLKFIICTAMALKEGNLEDVYTKPMELVKTSVPALLYFGQNNVVFVALANLNVATYTLLRQSQVLLTAFLSVLMLKQRFKHHQWGALVLLTIGVCIVQLESSRSHSKADKLDSDNASYNHLVGMIATGYMCFSSATAGVYFELLLKDCKLSLWNRNIQLSGYALFFGVFTICSDTTYDLVMLHGWFQGYTPFTFAIVILNGLGGLIVASVIKYADNTAKNFIYAFSVILQIILSVWLFGFTLTPEFLCGAAVVIGSGYCYKQQECACFGTLSVAADHQEKSPDEAEMSTEAAILNGNLSPTSLAGGGGKAPGLPTAI